MIARQDFARVMKEWRDHVPLLRVTGEGFRTLAAPGVEYVFVGVDDSAVDPVESLRAAMK
jgi:hypothetical protein